MYNKYDIIYVECFIISVTRAIAMVEILTFENKTSIVITDAKGDELKLIEMAKSLQNADVTTHENPEQNRESESKMSMSVFAKFKCNQKKTTTQHKTESSYSSAPVQYNEDEKIRDILNGESPNQRRNRK